MSELASKPTSELLIFWGAIDLLMKPIVTDSKIVFGFATFSQFPKLPMFDQERANAIINSKTAYNCAHIVQQPWATVNQLNR